ncbi:hypothetical protein L798_09224 [Zootermopsis nevadensis]|uniref:Uncharacterized protein n=1 Tax=Zootermopsis nevadensis TaxID=136037 RepID=A0A067RB05_ZOONE|nr:hypothetical protein L798_09224 [Zootermopsis nevadensis]
MWHTNCNTRQYDYYNTIVRFSQKIFSMSQSRVTVTKDTAGHKDDSAITLSCERHFYVHSTRTGDDRSLVSTLCYRVNGFIAMTVIMNAELRHLTMMYQLQMHVELN